MQCSGLVLRRQLMQYGNHHLPRAGAEPFLLQHKPGATSGSTEVHKIASSGSGRLLTCSKVWTLILRRAVSSEIPPPFLRLSAVFVSFGLSRVS